MRSAQSCSGFAPKSQSQTCPTFESVAINSIVPAAVNDAVYRPINPNDPEIIALAKSIKKEGILSPIHVTKDNVILSGHRRYTAAKRAGLLTVPVIRVDLMSTDNRFLTLLVECNRQRTKSFDEVMREAAISVDTSNAYRHLLAKREEVALRAIKNPDIIPQSAVKKRKAIGPAKQPFCDAIVKVINELKDFWPLSVRQVHYRLLNDPPLRNSKRPGSTYANNVKCYKDLCEILTRLRLLGRVGMSVITDETRPVTTWDVHRDPQVFIQQKLDNFLRGYYRDYVQSQPNHVEIVAERLTVKKILETVAMEYCIPLTIGRGYSSLDTRYQLVKRFRKSGKQNLVILFVSDYDPEGEDLAASFARSLRDDFKLKNVVSHKVALTGKQVETLNLTPQMTAKVKSSRRKKFVEANGENVYELEALPPETLQAYLRESIESFLDIGLFNAEKDRERSDAASLERYRQMAITAVKAA